MLADSPPPLFFLSQVFVRLGKKKLSFISSYDMCLQFLFSFLLVCVCPLRIFELAVEGGLGCSCDLAWLFIFFNSCVYVGS